LNGKTIKGPKRQEVERFANEAMTYLEKSEKIAFYENMISENLSPNGKDSKMTMKMIVSSNSGVSGKVDKIVDFFESVINDYLNLFFN